MTNRLKIEYVDIDSIKPYKNNARKHEAADIDAIAASIRDFEFNDPLGVWHGEIVEGYGRWLAAKKRGLTQVPIIRLDDLTDEQRRGYALAHNRTAELSEWDAALRDLEVADLAEMFDMEDFGFELPDFSGDDFPILPAKDDRRSSLQHNVFDNQERQQFPEANYYGFPAMKATQTYGDKLLRFCDWKDCENPSEYIAHFYYDDYKFISAWKDPDKYPDRLRAFKAVISPDFSLYTDFPRALQILSCYRRQWCGAYWQSKGIDVIPDVIWGDEESFKWCFDGIPERSVVAVSSVGVARDDDWNNKQGDMFRKGYNAMLDKLKPTKIIFYGTMIDGLSGDIIRVPSFYEERRKQIGGRLNGTTP